jgi:hypothetical protein
MAHSNNLLDQLERDLQMSTTEDSGSSSDPEKGEKEKPPGACDMELGDATEPEQPAAGRQPAAEVDKSTGATPKLLKVTPAPAHGTPERLDELTAKALRRWRPFNGPDPEDVVVLDPREKERVENDRKRRMYGVLDTSFYKHRLAARLERNIRKAMAQSNRPTILPNREKVVLDLLGQIRVLEGRRSFIKKLHMRILVDILVFLPSDHGVHSWTANIGAEVGRMHHAALTMLINMHMALTLDSTLRDSIPVVDSDVPLYFPRLDYNPFTHKSVDGLRLEDIIDYNQFKLDLQPVCDWINKPRLLDFLERLTY